MGLLSLSLPTIGQPNSTEDTKVRSALSAIQTEFNGNIESTNLDSTLLELLVPVAAVLPYASSTAPSGFLICDGSAVSRTTYSALFGKIDELYGAGDGSTTFNLPDLRGRVVVGKGTNAAVDTLGETEGISTVANRTPAHWHDGNTLTANLLGSVGGGAGVYPGVPFNFDTVRSGVIDINGSVGVTTAAEDTPSFQVLNHIIKT